MNRKLLLLVVGLLAMVSPCFGETITSYHIGNSLTWDARPTAYPDLSAQLGLEHESGHHILCGKSLAFIVRRHHLTCKDETPFGRWREALPGSVWDTVSLQLYPHIDSTLTTETAAAIKLIDLAQENPENADTQFVIYGAWPAQIDHESYAEAWLAETDPDDPDTPSAHSRAYQRAAFEKIAAARPDANITFLSTGELFFQAEQKIKEAVDNGEDWLGLTDVSGFYHDEFHMSSKTGRWLAALAMWKAVTGGDPSTLVPSDADFHTELGENMEFRDGIAQFVEEMFATAYFDPRELDCSRDGSIDAADLSCVESIGQRDGVLNTLGTVAGDLDGNGVVSIADFLTLAGNYGDPTATYSEGNVDLQAGVGLADLLILASNFGQPRAAVAVPEGTSCLAALAYVFALLRKRRATRYEAVVSRHDCSTVRITLLAGMGVYATASRSTSPSLGHWCLHKMRHQSPGDLHVSGSRGRAMRLRTAPTRST